MKFSANNSYLDKTKVCLEFTLSEQEDMELGITKTAQGLVEVIAELLKRTCDTVTQGEILVDIIMKHMQTNLKSFLKNELQDALDSKQEKELYEYMRECFYRWLHDIGLTHEKWIAKYRGSQNLTLEPVLLDSGLVAIMFSSATVGDHLMILDPKNRGTEAFSRALSEAYLIATVGGDVIFGSEKNPIRALPVGNNADGGLTETIDYLLKQEEK